MKKKKWRVLDLFCGAGGAAAGLKMAGFDEIVGVDINPQPDYPFEFHQGNAIEPGYILDLEGPFDFIWASPPCQAFTSSTNSQRFRHGYEYPNLVPATKKLLDAVGLPYCIENVPGAPIRTDFYLHGGMFDIGVYRVRKFEVSGFFCLVKKSPKPSKFICVTSGKPRGHQKNSKNFYHGGHLKGVERIKRYQEAMQIFWTDNLKSLAEAVPPKYSEYIGKAFLRSRHGVA